MAKEGYSNKGWANYHGKPLDSATKGEKKRNMGAETAAMRAGADNDLCRHGLEAPGEFKVGKGI